MIDTSIYDLDIQVEAYLPCYNEFFQHNKFYSKEQLHFETVKKLRYYQLLRIIEAITSAISNKATSTKATSTKAISIKHVIIVGHHPIYQLKSKNGAQYMSDIHINFTPVLKAIYNILSPRKNDIKYYYLCSDLHLYQRGIIKLKVKHGKNMIINQYIVGTGGTELDKDLHGIILQSHAANKIHYDLKEEIQDHGYLECIVTEGSDPTFKFIPITVPNTVPVPDQVSGGRKYNRTKSKSKKYKKRMTKRMTKKVY